MFSLYKVSCLHINLCVIFLQFTFFISSGKYETRGLTLSILPLDPVQFNFGQFMGVPRSNTVNVSYKRCDSFSFPSAVVVGTWFFKIFGHELFTRCRNVLDHENCGNTLSGICMKLDVYCRLKTCSGSGIISLS